MEKQNLDTTLVYVLAVLGFLCCCIAGLGVIPAGVAFFIAHSKLKQANVAPENYTNISGMTTAKTVALVSLIINILCLIWSIYKISIMGVAFFDLYSQTIEQYRAQQ